MSTNSPGTNQGDPPSTPPHTIEARFATGLPDSADDETRLAFFNYCIENYKHMDWKGDSLSEYFADDFANFTVDNFASIPNNSRRTMRDLLRKRGVYVRKGRGVLISEALMEVVKEDLPWPNNERESGEHSQIAPNVNQTHERETGSGEERTRTDSQQQGMNNGNDTRSNTGNKDDRHHNNAQVSYNRSNISNLSKAYYSDGDRYNGLPTDNFDRKLCLFEERCDQASVPNEDKQRAFSIMLAGRARDFYFDNLRGKDFTFDEMTAAVKRRFITAEHERSLVREWDNLSLNAIIADNVGRPRKHCLEELVTRMHALQSGLPGAYCNDEIFKNKLLNAVKDVEECRFAYFKPASTVEGLISDLHSSLAIEPSPQSSPALNAHFVDRRYKGQRGRGSNRSVLHCIVCKKKGCWSTNHSKEDRLAALRKNRQVRQFFTAVQEESEQENETSVNDDNGDMNEEQLQELEDLAGTAHVVQVDLNLDDEEVRPTGFFATAEDSNNTTAYIACIRDAAVSHALTATLSIDSRYDAEFFYGVMIDTGCARASSGGLSQYRAYCRHVGQPENIDPSKKVFCKFGISGTDSIGRARVQFPIKGIMLEFSMHVIDDDLPILLSLADMDKLGIYYNNLTNSVIHQSSKERMEVTRFYGHPFLRWDPTLCCFFTYKELKRLHKRFGHPHADKLYNLLKRADLSNVDNSTRATLEEITRKCKPCQTYAQAPRRFKFVLRDDKDFNHTVFVDIFYIDKKPILHVVDEATRYQAARWLPNVTADAVWRAMRLCWIDVYLGPPDIVTHDAGKQFIAKVFQTNAALLHITTKCVPIESPNSMSYVERYHTPIRHAYKIVIAEATELDAEAALQVAVKSVNDSIGPDGLVPTLLVYGALPRLGFPNDPPTPSTFQRAIALRKATEAMTKYFAKSQVSNAVRTRNGPDTSDIHSAPIDSHVLVYRPEIDKWDGPFSLLDIQGETCTVLLPPPSGPKQFRTTVVKRFIPDDKTTVTTNDEPNPTPLHPTQVQPVGTSQANTMTIESNRETRATKEDLKELVAFAAKMVPQSKDNEKYAASRKKEIDGLLNRGVFIPATVKDAHGHRIYKSRFIDYVKNEGTPEAFEKSRFVASAFNDDVEFLTHAPTVMRASQRLLTSTAASDEDFTIKNRDVDQAYTQAKTKLQRKVFIKPAPVLGYPPNFLFQAILPIYGLPESGLHWFHSYSKYHKEKLHMTPSVYDTCLMYTEKCIANASRSPSVPRGVVCLQTDDTMYACNKAFSDKEERMSKNFDCKEAKFIKDGTSLKFNGAIISRYQHNYTITQTEHIEKLNRLDINNATNADFVAERARGAYIAAVCRPDVTYAFSAASQITKPEMKDFKVLNKTIELMIKTKTQGLRFVPLDLDSIVMAVFVDAGFATNPDSSSQLGFIITLIDTHDHANIIHYGSIKSKRVTRSVLAAELFAMVHGFDVSSTIRLALNDMLDRVIPLRVYTDSRSLYDCLTRINQTAEKRLLIDLRMLRQSYERREITEVLWIPTAQNPADAFTKAKTSPALKQLMMENRILLTPNAWVERSVPTWSQQPITSICAIFEDGGVSDY